MPLFKYILPHADKINLALKQKFMVLLDTDEYHRSHLVLGRYENLYINRDRVAEIEPVLSFALAQAAQLLRQDLQMLRIGFWFNMMLPGQSTSLHTHDNHDELLSGVYYLAVPENSGDLVLHLPQSTITHSPKPGEMLFFHPDVPHEVTCHEGSGPRISIAFNIGIQN